MEPSQTWLTRMFWLLIVVLGVTAVAYLVAPHRALHLVGITSDATDDFLLRTTAAAILAFLPPLWFAVARPSTSLRVGLAWMMTTYLVVGAIVDLAAFLGDVVSSASIPSAVVRIVVAVVIVAVWDRRAATTAPSDERHR